MKIYWSTFLSLTFLLALASCGGEQFGTTPQADKPSIDAVKGFEQVTCSGHTLVRPLVDILYVVDNSTSSYYVPQDIKTGIQNTINSISSQFDYRVIGTTLFETALGNQEYQVLSKSQESLPASIPQSKIVTSSGQFNFFQKIVENGTERGLGRVQSFIANHQTDLFRQNAYLFIVLVSNGRDVDVEHVIKDDYVNTHQTEAEIAAFNNRKNALLTIKSYLQNQQMRLFSVTANDRSCGHINSPKSYGAMSQALLDASGPLNPYPSNNDHFDLCNSGGISALFAGINASIKQIIIPHKYKYWPITFSETPTGLNLNEIKVYKSSPTQAPSLMPASSWKYVSNENFTSYNSRIEPKPEGEPINTRHLIEFTSGNEIVYPNCVQITSVSNLEYFGYVVIPKVPKMESVVLKINGKQVTQSESDGWTYLGQATRNIKVEHNGFANTPTAMRTGYMFQLNGANNYYKSGDSVEIFYVPASN